MLEAALLVLAVYLAAVLQTTVAPLLAAGGASPDLFALLAIVWLTRWPRRELLVGVAVGLAHDLSGAGPFGLGVAAYPLLASIVGVARRQVGGESLLVGLLVGAAAAAMLALIDGLAVRLTGGTSVAWPTLVVRAVTSGTLTAVVGLPVLMAMRWTGRPTRALAAP